MSPDRCAECALVDRRTFLAQTTLAGVAAFLAACSGGGGPTGPSFSGPLVISPAQYASLGTVGGIARVDTPDGYPVAVVRMGAQQYAAFSLVCPHQGATVNISGSGFLCPGHGARFASDGKWVGGQPTSNLHSLSATYDAGSGQLTIG